MSKVKPITYEKEGVQLHIDDKGVSISARSFHFSSQPNPSTPTQYITMNDYEVTLNSKIGENHG
ncbi:hypothetical protein C4G95_RS22605 [Vibrio parahaemolyticus]|nr:hypothetical protein [Vibrio parahaemolyticus]EIA1343253.1 hypothetical protein [Vibrio parahaemolyticus]EJG0961780.1 hypothetical protein [Vibrio parahaemolyticus]EJG1861756.1 hypothetical protein [Vibrio parahaemolyticus]